jgi:hypothetical protein
LTGKPAPETDSPEFDRVQSHRCLGGMLSLRFRKLERRSPTIAMVAAMSPIFHSNPIAYQDGKDNPAYRFRESKQWPSIKKCHTTFKRLIEKIA